MGPGGGGEPGLLLGSELMLMVSGRFSVPCGTPSRTAVGMVVVGLSVLGRDVPAQGLAGGSANDPGAQDGQADGSSKESHEPELCRTRRSGVNRSCPRKRTYSESSRTRSPTRSNVLA